MGRSAASLARATAAAVGALCTIALFASHAAAQLTPDRLYYGVNRPMPMTVSIPSPPDGAPAADAQIQLLDPASPRAAAAMSGGSTPEGAAAAPLSAPVKAGGVDMAALFPSLWTASTPRLYYAQLVVGGRKTGPAVVLQPMVTPPYPVAMDADVRPRFPSDASRKVVYSGIRAYVDKLVLLDTTKGPIRLALRPDAAPNTAWNFRQLVEGGFYTDIAVHRVIPMNPQGHPFIIQAGDPSGRGDGNPGYYIDLEPSTLPHDFGVISMARGADPNTAGSQFFICLSREGTASLDGLYTTFAQAVDLAPPAPGAPSPGGSSAEAIQAIAAVPIAPPGPQGRDHPIDPPIIRSATLVDAPPHGEGVVLTTPLGAGPIRK